ncbi:MAG: hypothetical protein J0I12_25315 [Candidatus Eremiobacteraeota bacterium]|nr:hypothetical protein [Candidatus Eremiobacteraeota bacterium]
MKKVQILVAAAVLSFGMALSASADNCCAQKGLQAGWFTGAGTLARAGHDHKADGSCCTAQNTDAKAGCACGAKADGKAAGSCCGGAKTDGKAEAKQCCGNCKK